MVSLAQAARPAVAVAILAAGLATGAGLAAQEGAQLPDLATCRALGPSGMRPELQTWCGLLLHEEGFHAEAFRWLRLAAEQGNAAAQFGLGLMYAKGQGVPQDFVEAVRWYRLAAEQGDADAQLNLGLMYAKGQGVPQDFVEAVRWYRLAAEQGDADAQFNLGLMYAKGQGVPQDFAEAARWYRLAAEQGVASAMNNLGVLYEHGLGVPRDLVQAYKWYNLAAARETDPESRERSVRNRDGVAAQLGPAELERAQRLARAWKPGEASATLSPDGRPGAGGEAVDAGLVREAQRLLARLGFDPGPADGIAGMRTVRAVRAFERAQGLPETGEIDARLVALLRALANRSADPMSARTFSGSR